MEVGDVVQAVCERAGRAAQDEGTEPDLTDLIGRVVAQAKSTAPQNWQVEAL